MSKSIINTPIYVAIAKSRIVGYGWTAEDALQEARESSKSRNLSDIQVAPAGNDVLRALLGSGRPNLRMRVAVANGQVVAS